MTVGFLGRCALRALRLCVSASLRFILSRAFVFPAEAEIRLDRIQIRALGVDEAVLDLPQVGFPRDTTVVAVLREEKVVVPRGDTILRPGDEVLILVTAESEDAARALLIA